MKLTIIHLLQLKGADPNGLRNLVSRHAGPNPPIPPLPEDAEAIKVAGNVCSCIVLFFFLSSITDCELGALPSQAVQRSPRQVHRGHPACCKLTGIYSIIQPIFTSYSVAEFSSALRQSLPYTLEDLSSLAILGTL